MMPRSMMDESVVIGRISLSMPLDQFEEQVEAEEDVCDVSQSSMKKGARQANYSNDEDEALVMAWESVTLDGVIRNDQSGANYCKRIEDQSHQNVKTPSNQTLKSLTNRWSVILESCNR